MDINGNGVEASVDVAKQPDQWLIDAAQEIAAAAEARGLELPTFAGGVAVEAAAETPALYTKESIAGQLVHSYKGYTDIIDALNDGGQMDHQLKRAFELDTAFDDWFTQDKLDYIVAVQEADPSTTFTLVATPNITVEPELIMQVARDFGAKQPHPTYVDETLYKQYSAHELSGTDPSNGSDVQFSLIPSKWTPGLTGTVAQQRDKLAEFHRVTPSLKIPSPLETVTYWSTLRAQGEQLADSATFVKTGIRHINLPEKRVDGYLCVPNSFVDVVGRPNLDRSLVRNDDYARVAVG